MPVCINLDLDDVFAFLFVCFLLIVLLDDFIELDVEPWLEVDMVDRGDVDFKSNKSVSSIISLWFDTKYWKLNQLT